MEKAPLNYVVSEAPDDGVAYWIKTSDGIRIRIGIWNARNEINGTIFFFTGRTEYIEKYGRNLGAFLNAGFSACVIDWRGQGLSDRETKDPRAGHVNSYDDYQLDVAAMMGAAEKLCMPKPWYMVGASMGACIGYRSLIEGIHITASVFSSPMWKISMSPMQSLFALPAALLMKCIGKGKSYTPGQKEKLYVLNATFEENLLTNDPDMFGYYKKQARELPDCQIAAPTFTWLYASILECSKLRKAPAPDTSSLVFIGSEDKIIDHDAVYKITSNWKKSEFEIIPSAKHDLYCEIPNVRDHFTNKIIEHFSQNK